MNNHACKMILEVVGVTEVPALKPHRIAGDTKVECVAKAITWLEHNLRHFEAIDVTAFLWHEMIYMAIDPVDKIMGRYHECTIITIQGYSVEVSDHEDVSSDRQWKRARKVSTNG